MARRARAHPGEPGPPGRGRRRDPSGGAGEVDAAIEAAEAAFPAWRKTPPPARGAILLGAAALLAARKDEAARDLTAEEGQDARPRRPARCSARSTSCASSAERAGGSAASSSRRACRTRTSTRSRSRSGVVGLITPWNFPIAIPTWKLAPALVAGNTVVFKPASLVPVSVQNLAEVLIEAGLPAGVLNIVYGPGSEVGDAIVRDPRVAAISFTGSVETGLGINALGSDRLARVQLEMGGKNAVVVLEDADPAFAAKIAAQGGFGLTGQACTATSRVIVTKAAHDRFVDALASRGRCLATGRRPVRRREDGPRRRPEPARDRSLLPRDGTKRGRRARDRRRGGRPVPDACRLHRRNALDADRPGGDLRAR